MSVAGRQRSARVPIRVRAAIRRHGFARRPDALRRALRARELRFTGGNRLRLFANGEEGLKAMLAAIRNARRRIHLETYILRTDITGQRFIDTLAAQAREGVAVRLLYDAFGSLAIDSGALAELRHAGADVVAFNPLRRFYPHWLPRRRDHRKLLIVDGQVGFTGGLNIGDEYNAGPQDGTRAWRDTHIQVEGPAVQELEAVFLESWFRADGPELPWGELLTAEPNPCGHDTCAVVADGPAYRRRVVRDLIVLALHTAGSEVQLTSPYFAPGRKVLGALAAASARGTLIGLLLAGRSDHPILRRAARALLPRLIAAGVQVYEYQRSMLHAKTSVLDGRWAIVGTSNLDRQSFEHSYEVNLVIEGGKIPTELSTIFTHDLAGATLIDADALAARTRLERLIDWLASLVLLVI